MRTPTKRIIVSVSPAEYEVIEQESERMGMLPSTYCKYMILEKIFPESQKEFTELMSEMQESLDRIPNNTTFTILSLFEPKRWRDLSFSHKKSLSFTLRNYIDDHPDQFEVTEETMADKTRIYRKK